MRTLVPTLLYLAYAVIGRCRAFGSLGGPGERKLVPRLTLQEFLSSPVYTTPVIIRNILPPDMIESLADDLVTALGQEEVQLQRKIKEDEEGSEATTELYDVSLGDCIDYMMDSCHDDARFAFCEGLLPSPVPGSVELSEKLQRLREAPFSDQENWFDYFPSQVQPTDAVILAGAGAASTLHRDPFEWTGTSVCLEGTKIWRFILPPHDSQGGVAVVDEALESYRLDSIAWEGGERNNDEQIVLSAGWQSDMTLYDAIGDGFPSARDWMQMEEEDTHGFQRRMQEAGTDTHRLHPCEKAMNALYGIYKAHDSHESALPLFVTAIQQPGDLLLIPAHCWHQTYAPVPSVAVASQRCGARTDGSNVVRHILEMATSDLSEEIAEILKCDNYEEGVGGEVVANLVKHLTRANPIIR